jgi:hypothetical protein
MSGLLEIDADRALFEGKLSGLVLTCYENERPLRGLAGLMDWRFHGVISECLRAGAVTGRVGECAYVPVSRHGKTYHLLLAGAGVLPASGRRGSLPAETLKALTRNLNGLRLPSVGVSRSDFGDATPEYFAKNLKGVPLWIAP